MDINQMNEILNQLANNPDMASQLVQIVKLMIVNGIIPANTFQQNNQMGWNTSTNPLADMWKKNMNNNMANMFNNMGNQNNSQPVQNNNSQQEKQTENNTDKLNIDVEALTNNISNLIDTKLNQFVKDYSLEKGNTKGKNWNNNNNKKGVEKNGEQ